jgi:hypothetical protein
VWLLERSFQGISPTKFVRKLLNVHSPWALKFTEITALVPFQQPRLFSSIDSSRQSSPRQGERVLPVLHQQAISALHPPPVIFGIGST